jgi:putative cell wall-binding protein
VPLGPIPSVASGVPVAPRRRTTTALLVALASLLPLLAAAPARAADTRGRIAQERWVEWQIADALTNARQSPRSIDPGAPEPAVGPLTGWTDLRDLARGWSDRMADERSMTHNPSYDEQMCCWRRAGEVLARLEVGTWLSSSDLAGLADRAVRAWFDSPGHRRLVLDGAYDQLGVGVTIDHDRGVAWIAVDLRDTTDQTPPGSAWYRPGAAGPARPDDGMPCDGEVAPYGVASWPLPASTVHRRSGGDRVATALALAEDHGVPDTVLLASSATPSDALAAAGLAGTLDAPVLLTDPSGLDGRVADRIAAWGPREVLLLGGRGALSGTVDQQVRDAAPSARVGRLRGSDRFATAAVVAERLADRGGDGGRVLLALGAHPQPDRAWADAVTVSGLAASHDHPVLLTGPSHLPDATRQALRALGPDHVVVAGGASGVGDGVLAEVRGLVPGARVERVAGGTRYDTSRAVVALDQQLRDGTTRAVHVVDGEDWPDALTAGPAAARAGAVVATVDGSRPDDAGPGVAHLEDLADRLDRLDLTLVGGMGAITTDRAETVMAAMPCVD